MDMSGDGGELVRVGEFGHSVDGGVHAEDPGDHQVLQGNVGADVVDEALLVQLGDGFGPQALS
ncbi:hypothetical protein ACWGQ5_20530 [Streptomyces sp. NPDC055722]